MIPVITYSERRGAWVIYLMPSAEAVLVVSRATWGRQYDRIERESVNGGLPMVWSCLPMTFPSKEAAEASIRRVVTDDQNTRAA